MIFRGVSFGLLPTPMQKARLAQEAGLCRLVWNLALEQRRDWWEHFQRQTGNNLNWVTQSRELTRLRDEIDFIRAGIGESQQRVIITLDGAFKQFFKGTSGFPSFKKKGAHDSFSIKGRSLKIERLNAKYGRVRLPKIGWIKFRQTQEIEGNICEATFYDSPKGWHVALSTKIERDVPDVGGGVGIDRGVAVPLALSDGQTFTLPDRIERLDKLQRKAQRIASRRKRGSSRYAKAQRRVRNISARKARIRKDWAHRTTTSIARQYGTVVIERLRTKDMTKSAKGTVDNPGTNVAAKRGLNRAILNVGWHQIERMLAYKAFRLVKVNPAFSSQTCSSCGTVDKQSRKSQAVFACVHCGFRDNADRNAAAVILSRGNTAALDVEGCGYAPGEASTVSMATAA